MRPAHGKWARNAPKTPARGTFSRPSGHVSAPNHGQRPFVQTFLSGEVPTSITTNGIALGRLSESQLSQLNWIRVSLHSASPDTSRRIMGDAYNVSKVLGNLRSLSRITQRFSLFTLITDPNGTPGELRGLIRTASDLGVRKIEFGIVKLIGWASPEMLVTKQRIKQLLDVAWTEASSCGIEVIAPDVDTGKHTCLARSRNAAVFPDGAVRSCSFDHDEPWGNILAEPLLEIWRRRAKLDDFCDRCSPGGYHSDGARKTIPILSSSSA